MKASLKRHKFDSKIKIIGLAVMIVFILALTILKSQYTGEVVGFLLGVTGAENFKKFLT